MRKRIENTAQTGVHPEWNMGDNPRAIETQEVRGQQQLVESTQLPTQCDKSLREELESEGVVFGLPLESDRLFCNAELPTGWSKRPTDHSMWSELVDADGKIRAVIFYKAAFYDRDAFMRKG